MKIDGLEPRHWARYLRHKARACVYGWLFVRIGRGSLFWSCAAYVIFLNDREREHVVRKLEISLLKAEAIVRRHPRKYNIVHAELY